MSAAIVFAEALTALVNQQDVESMIQAQKHMMSRFEKTNEMLINCNALSAVRYHTSTQDFKNHTQLLLDMKKDLDIIFKKIRTLKRRLAVQYPSAFKACDSEPQDFDGLDDNETKGGDHIGAEGENVSSAPAEVCCEVVVHKASNNSSSCSQSSSPVSPATSLSTSESG